MIKKILLSCILALSVASFTQAADWKLDQVHSSVQFKVSHLVISRVVGQFDQFDATMKFDGESVAGGSVEMTVGVASINTDNENRDNHLRSDDFFSAEKFPQMTFKSTKVTPGSGGEFKLTGDLTIRDVTKEVTFDCMFHGAVDFMGGKKSGFSATTTIDRQEFGLAWSKAMETGGLVVGNEVEINLELEFDLAK